ncbi:MAG: Arf family protein [Candidatus Korarchaeota archaeon]|nr:Arf family protein [Candidatus Korarchaeota archaeon]
MGFRKLVSGLLGLFRKSATIVILGLDGAGKTTMLNYLMKGEPGSTIPTVGANFERIRIKSIEFNIWDLGGQRSLRRMWAEYADKADAIIFMIDSADEERFDEAKKELWNVVSIMKRGVPLLILANKADLEEAATIMEIIERFELTKLEGITWQVVWTSALTGFGLFEAFSWLYEQLTGKQVTHPLRIEEMVILDEEGNPLVSTSSSRSLTLSAFLALTKNYTGEALSDVPQSIEMRDRKIIIVSRGGFLAAALIPKLSPESKVRALLVDVLDNIAKVRDQERAKDILMNMMEKYIEIGNL